MSKKKWPFWRAGFCLAISNLKSFQKALIGKKPTLKSHFCFGHVNSLNIYVTGNWEHWRSKGGQVGTRTPGRINTKT